MVLKNAPTSEYRQKETHPLNKKKKTKNLYIKQPLFTYILQSENPNKVKGPFSIDK